MSLLKFIKLSESEIQQACMAYVQQITAVSEPIAIYMFGSMAHGNANIESDIDLLSIYKDRVAAKEAQSAVWRQQSPCSVSADLIFIDYDTWMDQDRYSPLIETVRIDGKLVFQSAKNEE